MLSNSINYSHDNNEDHITRLDTTFTKDIIDKNLTLDLGDTYTSAPEHGSMVKIGGFRVSRNFTQLSSSKTAPLMNYSGSATLPSTVDLYINNIRKLSQSISPGQFELTDFPSQEGYADVSMIVTDITGKKIFVITTFMVPASY